MPPLSKGIDPVMFGPNITGQTRALLGSVRFPSDSAGVFSDEVATKNWAGTSDTEGNWWYVNLDAAKANSIYGSTGTIRPLSCSALPCIHV